jgi:AraC-like DNA-binding protein
MKLKQVPHRPGESAPLTGPETLKVGLGPPQPKIVRLNFGPARLQPTKAPMSNHRLVEKLAASVMFREFQRSFEDATRLPLTLRNVESWQLAHAHSRRQNGFCTLMSQADHSCSACLQMQQNVCDGVNDAACTRNCAFGLGETAVGVRIGQETIAYLQTGQVFFKSPTLRQTQRALKRIKDWGLNLDAGEVSRRYRETPVVPRSEYDATVRLLQFFANQLGPLGSQLLLLQQTAEPEQITRARNFIGDQYREILSLDVVARHAGMSAFYFCKTFKKNTGMHYTMYLSRVRVEEAKKLLVNLNYRICEVGYEVGFQSLSHFNRAFRRIAGETPTEYREQLSRG